MHLVDLVEICEHMDASECTPAADKTKKMNALPAFAYKKMTGKRGRPPKKQVHQKWDESVLSLETEDASTSLPAAQRKRRGRPPKKLKSPELTETVRCCGHPPPTVENEPDGDMEELEQTIECWIVEKGKRPCDGREEHDSLAEPAIVCDQIEDDQHEGDGTDKLLGAMPKRRGRPPKCNSPHKQSNNAMARPGPKKQRKKKKALLTDSSNSSADSDSSELGEGDEWIPTLKVKPSPRKYTPRLTKTSKCDTKNNATKADTRKEETALTVAPDIDEPGQTEPNGIKLIKCLICGEQMNKIHRLRKHLQLHGQGEDMDDQTLEAAPIYEYLNPYKRKIDTPVIRDFLVKEIKAKRSSQCYVILAQTELELHVSDSETDSEAEEEAGAATTASKLIPRNTYKCDLCNGLPFVRRYKALHHQRTVHGAVAADQLPYRCYCCRRGFVGLQLLLQHMKTRCESDEQPFPLLERFWRHLARANLELMENFTQARRAVRRPCPADVQRDFACDKCEKRFMRLEHLVRHKLVHMPEDQKIRCPHCPDRTFCRKDNLKLHMKVHMDESERSQLEQKEILCANCGLSFKRLSNYVIHVRRHHTGEKPYACDVCSKRFVCSTDLNSHRLTHTHERNFGCEVCGKRFARSGMLTKHMSCHGGTAAAASRVSTTQHLQQQQQQQRQHQLPAGNQNDDESFEALEDDDDDAAFE